MSDREQKYLAAIQAARIAADEKQFEGQQLEKVTKAIKDLLPIWDVVLPLVVRDIVKAVKEANANG